MATLLNNIKDLVSAIAADIKDIRNSIPAPYEPPNSGVTAATYGNSASVPVTTVDAKGRVTKVVNTAIRAATTATTGIVKLNSTVTSIATNEAATASAVKTAYDLANAAIPATQKGAASGVANLGADGKVPYEQLPVFRIG